MIGKTLAHYEILSKLGEGGMGEVFRARDTKLGRDVALKVLPAEPGASSEFKQRFAREVRSLATLRHPNIVTVHAFEEAADVTFYTMEYVEGQSLATRIPRRGLVLDRFFRIAVPLSDAVAHAHARGVTHRDLKPANIMLDAEGAPRVLDFGLARLTHPETSPNASTVPLSDFQTDEGRILGTVAYMSPEQAEGKVADHRSDLFSLGIILYEMATGQRPFQGDTPVSTLSSIIKDAPASITDINGRLPRHLWRIVKKCLEKDPGRRYQSAIDLRNDLEGLRSEIDSGELAPPPTRSGSRLRAGRWWWPALAIIIAAVGLVGYLVLSRHGAPAASPLVRLGDSVDLTRSGRVEAADLSPDGRLLVYTQRDDNLSSLRVLQLSTSSDVEILPPQADELTRVQVGPAGDLAYFLNEDRRALYRVSLLGGSPQRLLETVDDFALAPDGRRLAIFRLAENRLALLLGDVAGGDLKQLQDSVVTGWHSYLDWSSDGESVVYNAEPGSGFVERLMQVSPAGDCLPLRDSLRWGYIDAINRLRDGSGLLVAAPRSHGSVNIQQSSEIWFVPASGDEPVMLTRDPFDYHSIGSDERGERLTAVQRRSTHTVWVLALADPTSRRQVMYASRTGRWWQPLAWTRDQKIIYPALTGEAVHLWEVGTDGTGRRRLTTSGTFNMCPSVSPDERTMAYASDRLEGTIRIHLMDREGGAPRRLTTIEENDEFFPDYSPDGQWVVFMAIEGKYSFLRKAAVADGRTVDLFTGWSFVPCYSPDGNLIACLAQDTLSHDFKMTILADDDGRILRTFPNLIGPGFFRIRWTPDGQALVYNSHQDDVERLWLQPVDGGEPRLLAEFASGSISGFALSAACDSIAVATMESERDVVMFEDYRGRIERAMRGARKD